jgi:hypothetical protein
VADSRKIREIRFPAGGIFRRSGYRDSADVTTVLDAGGVKNQHTTPWAINCRPQDVFEKRLRGGSRSSLSFGSGTVTITPVVVTGGTVRFLNPATKQMTAVSPTVGSLPACTFGTLYRDRLLLAGTGNGIYASRQGDFTDYGYGAVVTDTGRATIYQLAEAGEIGPPATALIPHKDSYLLSASAGGLWSLQGDPVTGVFRNVSRNVGCVGPNAWTKIDDRVVFLAADGLYSCHVSGEGLVPLSHEKVPDELRNSSALTVLGYNHDERGIYIFVPGGSYHWFYDLTFGGFWPMTTTVVPNQAAITESGLVMALNGVPVVVGGVESIVSHVLLGPIRTSSPSRVGRVMKLQGTMAAILGQSLRRNDVVWNIVPGDSAEGAVQRAVASIAGASGYVASRGIFTAGQSHSVYPRIRSTWIVLWLSATTPWAYESIMLETTDSGVWR